MRTFICALMLFVMMVGTPQVAGQVDPVKRGRMLSPEEAMKTIRVPEGYKLELVASEPIIEEPVICVWDGNGRMYVAEMRSYMQDIDGKGQFRPISRVMLLEDTNGDGHYNKHSVFIDKLVLPRMLLPLDNGELVVRETNTFDLWRYKDTDGDGKADEKVLWHKGGNRGGNLEHQPSGLIWNIDNWIYTTYSNHRYRATNGKVVREGLPHGSGQWGLTHDDVGKIYYSSAGGENPAYDFQQPIVYGKISLPGEKAGNFNTVYPIDDIPDVQGGLRRVRKDGSLNHFTASAGQTIFRGHRMPGDLYGDLIIPEPVGRLIRRAKVTNVDGKTVLSNAYEEKEFIASTDANFRPLNTATGPDGALYIVDMYRGIIQEGNWVRNGSYLRKVVQKYELDKNIGRGRIYRLVHKDYKRDLTQPKMLDQKNSELVQYLSHANGWWRDNAQKLLVIRRDASVVPALKALARDGKSHLGRLHALWTLEGMDVLDKTLLNEKLSDEHAYVRAAAVRISERLFQAGDSSMLSQYKQLAKDKDPNVVVQVLLSSQYVQLKELDDVVKIAYAAYPDNEAVMGVSKSYYQRLEAMKREAAKRAELEKINKFYAGSMTRGKGIYDTLCFACHGADGKGMQIPGTDMMMAPTLVKSERVLGSQERMVRIILHGLTGPVDGKTYIQQMVPMASNGDQWVADVATYIRNSFGNKAPLIVKEDVTRIREASQGRATPWTLKELQKFDPVLRSKPAWKVSASHKSGGARAAIDGNLGSRWDTGTPMRNGMWFQVELPSETMIQGIMLDAAGSTGDYPRGYEVMVSTDGKNWSKPIAKGNGRSPKVEISFKPVKAKFVKIVQTGRTNGLFWSIHNMDIVASY